MTKNNICTAEITDYGSEGFGVCHIGGQAVFVRGAARGDICDVRILKTTSRAAWGKIENIIQPSPHRVENDCAAFPMCGGCDLRHISYGEELRFKCGRVEQALRRIAGTDLKVDDIIPSRDVELYRNKAIIPVGINNGRVEMGFYRSHSHDIVPCPDCKINAPEINLCAAVTGSFLQRNGIGGARHFFARAVSGGVQAALITDGSGIPRAKEWVSELREKCAGIKSVLVIKNTRRDNVLLSGAIETLWGGLTLTESLGGLEFELHPFAFAQVNSRQAEKLYGAAVELAAPDGCVAADLYCGTGTITLWLARSAKAVYGVELEPSAVECAKRNALRNGIGNAVFIAGDAGSAELPEKPGVAVIDPPRSGLNAAALEMIVSLAPGRLVYVSCDPGTLARDIKLLGLRGYTAQKCRAFDMFPRTRHVESIVLLQRA